MLTKTITGEIDKFRKILKNLWETNKNLKNNPTQLSTGIFLNEYHYAAHDAVNDLFMSLGAPLIYLSTKKDIAYQINNLDLTPSFQYEVDLHIHKIFEESNKFKKALEEMFKDIESIEKKYLSRKELFTKYSKSEFKVLNAILDYIGAQLSFINFLSDQKIDDINPNLISELLPDLFSNMTVNQYTQKITNSINDEKQAIFNEKADQLEGTYAILKKSIQSINADLKHDDNSIVR